MPGTTKRSVSRYLLQLVIACFLVGRLVGRLVGQSVNFAYLCRCVWYEYPNGLIIYSYWSRPQLLFSPSPYKRKFLPSIQQPFKSSAPSPQACIPSPLTPHLSSSKKKKRRRKRVRLRGVGDRIRVVRVREVNMPEDMVCVLSCFRSSRGRIARILPALELKRLSQPLLCFN